MATIEPRDITLRDGRRVTLRTATVDDADAVFRNRFRIAESTRFILTSPQDLRSDTIANQRAFLAGNFDRDDAITLAPTSDGQIAGLCGVTRSPTHRHRNRHVASLGIALLPEWRGAGLGRALTEVLIAWARAHPQLERLTLEVVSRNTAGIRLYESLGFAYEGRMKRAVRYDDGDYDDELFYALDVRR
jgi:RimJ/RimL family protein N-acetyltransferase